MTDTTVMFSDRPLSPGTSWHMPRTLSMILTPAREARYRASMISRSHSEFILAAMSPGDSGLDRSVSRSIIETMRRLRSNGAIDKWRSSLSAESPVIMLKNRPVSAQIVGLAVNSDRSP